jgi:hypothetical protein
MAIVVLVLWLLTAGAGFYVLATSSLGRARAGEPAARAHLCGAAPIPASSGKITRWRLNRGGNRETNPGGFIRR